MRIAAVFALVLLASCDAPPVQWSDPVAIAGTGTERLMLTAAGQPSADTEHAALPAMPSTPGICESSIRTTSSATRLHAAWWKARPDSSAVLYTATSSDSGRSWGVPSVVDSLDKSTRGCSRPAPALATVGDDLQLAYSMSAPEGTGVFFAHYMGTMLHEPVAVIFGERLVATAIAAEGDRVAVAYEEPNGTRAQVDVALSATQGHIFEVHTIASRGVDVASAPSIALTGQMLAVAWTTRRAIDSASSRVVRVGRLQ